MTALNVIGLRDTLLSHALASGLFDNVAGHEPKASPGNGVYAALWVQEIGVAAGRSGLTATAIRVEYSIRIGTNMLGERQDDIDPAVMVAAASLVLAYSGDFQLGGFADQVDLLGAYGAPLAARAGYLNQDGVLYRVMVVTVPVIVDDVFTQTP
jgi:hypothetical protein